MGRKVFFTGDANFDERLEDLASEDEFAAALWPWMLTYLDDWGRAPFNIRRIKEQVFGQFPSIDHERTEQIVRRFSGVGLLAIYEAKGRLYLAVEPDKWFEYQTHIHRNKRKVDKSKCPAPDPSVFDMENQREKSRRIAENRGESRDRAEVRGESREIAENRASSLPPYHPTKDNGNAIALPASDASPVPNKISDGMAGTSESDKPSRVYTADEKRAVNHLRDELVARGVVDFARNWHLKGYAVARNMLKTRSSDELVALIDEAFLHPHWAHRLTDMFRVQDYAKERALRQSVAHATYDARAAPATTYSRSQEAIRNFREKLAKAKEVVPNDDG